MARIYGYTSPVAPGSWHGGGTGPMQAAKIAAYKARMANTRAFRGTDSFGNQSYYQASTGRSGLRRPGQYAPAGGGGGDELADQFGMPYKINQSVLSGYEDRERTNAANQAAIGTGYQDRFGRNMGYLTDAYANERMRIDEDARRAAAAQEQDMVSRGLRNSSVAATANTGVERMRQQALGDVGEAVRRERLATDANLSGQQLQYLERANANANELASDRLRFTERTKADYPGFRDWAQLSQSLGQGGIGGGGGRGAGRYAGLAGVDLSPIVADLSSYGYNVPNMTTMPAANLRPAIWNRSMGRSPLERLSVMTRGMQPVERAAAVNASIQASQAPRQGTPGSFFQMFGGGQQPEQPRPVTAAEMRRQQTVAEREARKKDAALGSSAIGWGSMSPQMEANRNAPVRPPVAVEEEGPSQAMYDNRNAPVRPPVATERQPRPVPSAEAREAVYRSREARQQDGSADERRLAELAAANAARQRGGYGYRPGQTGLMGGSPYSLYGAHAAEAAANEKLAAMGPRPTPYGQQDTSGIDARLADLRSQYTAGQDRLARLRQARYMPVEKQNVGPAPTTEMVFGPADDAYAKAEVSPTQQQFGQYPEFEYPNLYLNGVYRPRGQYAMGPSDASYRPVPRAPSATPQIGPLSPLQARQRQGLTWQAMNQLESDLGQRFPRGLLDFDTPTDPKDPEAFAMRQLLKAEHGIWNNTRPENLTPQQREKLAKLYKTASQVYRQGTANDPSFSPASLAEYQAMMQRARTYGSDPY